MLMHMYMYIYVYRLELNFTLILKSRGTSLEVQWLRLHASTARGMGLIPDPGTKIPHAMQRKK